MNRIRREDGRKLYMKMIEIENLTSAYGRKNVLQGVSFEAERGDCIGIVGPNGCGKSTLLSILAGVLKPSSGTIRYYGKNALENQVVFRKMTGYVPQENPLMPELSVYDNLRLWYPDKKELAKELEEGFLRILGISEFLKMPVSKLSGGMKKRVSIGIALAGIWSAKRISVIICRFIWKERVRSLLQRMKRANFRCAAGCTL